jgi:endoglucanase
MRRAPARNWACGGTNRAARALWPDGLSAPSLSLSLTHSPPPPSLFSPSPKTQHRLVEALDQFDTAGGAGPGSDAGDDGDFLLGGGAGGGGDHPGSAAPLDSLYGDDDGGWSDDGWGNAGNGKGATVTTGVLPTPGPGKKYKVVREDEETDEDDDIEYVPAPYTADAPEWVPPPEGEPAWPAKKFKRGWRLDRGGVTVMALYVLALFFYLYVRVAHTLDLGSYVWYGVFVLMVEILGATTTLLYGINIVADPVHEPPRPDPDNPGLVLVDHPYHVRVLVPVYKESLEIVTKTISAALSAALPAGCGRTVYLCDDGRDPAKRRWCEAAGPEVVYVSGRTRKPGEMNGKSANLNNCLSHVYPLDLAIPPHELVCIFDADQVANPDFFLKTVPLFDAGDDVGMVLSPQVRFGFGEELCFWRARVSLPLLFHRFPHTLLFFSFSHPTSPTPKNPFPPSLQCFYNLDPAADIFNHGNVQFWEYAQTGYDAFGFISCTGTNFLTRSRAFYEAGWSPEYTLTEDYALGMELKKRRWECRYVNEYLAVGEAPEQLRNCFQQRSRWAKGHFQVRFFWFF